ncbi:MAG: hypothetical protein ABIL62_18195 [Planctomycetota bacterium]
MPDSKELVDILSLAPLEKYALICSRDSRRKLLTSYLALREKITYDFLPLISSKEPYMNDHSRGHIERVLSYIESILEFNFPRPGNLISDIPADRLLTWADTLILLNALVWHDIGNVYGRSGHAAQVRKCFDDISPHLYDEHLKQYICQVAEAHSGDGAIEKIIPTSHAAGSYQGIDIHLQFLAAVLRFADEIDEDHRRATPDDWQRLDLIPEPKRRFWYFSKVNSSIQVRSEQWQFGQHFWVNIETHIPRSEFSINLAIDGQQIKALSEYCRRILKFDRERHYCNKYIATFYHPGIKGIRIRLMTHEKSDSPAAARSFEMEMSDDRQVDDLISDTRLSDLRDYITEAKQY